MNSSSSRPRSSSRDDLDRTTKRPRLERRVNQDTPTASTSSAHEVYANGLTTEQKCRIFSHVNRPLLRELKYHALCTLAVEHNVPKAKTNILLPALLRHDCSWLCIICTADAHAAGIGPVPNPIPSETSSSRWRPPKSTPVDEAKARKLRRIAEKKKEDERNAVDQSFWRDNWPQVETVHTLKEIMQDNRAQTTTDALRRRPCSFCNRNELNSKLKTWTIDKLDISLLDATTEHLRSLVHHPALDEQPPIRSHQLYDGMYTACPTCRRCIKGGKFVKVPVLSWANGCWIGNVPEELACLTYAEELVIARAHTTKCWVKLNGSNAAGSASQRATSGNVCIHPHEITNLASKLPRPINTLYDEIVVMFVSNDRPVTADMLQRTPFLVRRERILRALLWLKKHNRLYHDIEIDDTALADYPDEEHDGGAVPYPVQHQPPTDSIRAQSSTYTGHGIDTTEGMFAVHETDSSHDDVPLSTSGTFDVEDSEMTLAARKIQALRYLKENGDFAKTSTSDETLSTRNHPEVYGMLWPTLFPYGVGMFEDPLRLQKDHGFKPIDLKTHVQRYLQLHDRRFQTHLSFIFVMHNIQMLRRSSFKSRLAVRRAWWPMAMAAMEKIDDDTLAEVAKTLASKKARRDFSKWEPATETEKAVADVMKYVDYVTDHMEGSKADVRVMREEIRALSRDSGTPSVFFTLNPADCYNPLASFIAGKDIDIDALFTNPDSRFTPFERARSLAANPVAGAEFFKVMMDQFTDVFLGFKRDLKRGVFGRVKHYYGVIEAQNRGSLHLHILIWLEGALSPRHIQEKVSVDSAFRERLFRWLESAFVHELPPETFPVEGSVNEKKKCLLGRPLHPNSPDFAQAWPQYLRQILDASAQSHIHTETCFKHIPHSMTTLSAADKDKLCRFNLPAEVVLDTFMDDDGKIHLKRLDGCVVGHTPIISGSLQCNTDAKFVGSGPFGMALSIYMTSYTAKSTLDSATIMSALTAAKKALAESNLSLTPSDPEEQCRRLLLKTLNQINGRRELSGQQVACGLLGIRNHTTDASFAVYYWSKLLTWLSSKDFPIFSAVRESNNADELDGDAESEGALPVADDLEDAEYNSIEEPLIVDLDDEQEYVILDGRSHSPPPKLNSLVYDILLRPLELSHICMYDQLGEYEKVTFASQVKKSKRRLASRNTMQRDTDTEDDSDEDDSDSLNDEPLDVLHFCCNHPQVDTHGLRKRCTRHIPVLTGYSVPRSDLPEQADKYAIATLALFKPWERSSTNPLKSPMSSWSDALHSFLQDAPAATLKIINHIQEQWECRLAADDFSKLRKGRLATFHADNGFDFSADSDAHDIIQDIDWQICQTLGSQPYRDPGFEREDADDFQETCSLRTKLATDSIIALADTMKCYSIPSSIPPYEISGQATEADASDRLQSQLATAFLAAEKSALLKSRAALDQSTSSTMDDGKTPSSDTRHHPPRITNLAEEKELAQKRVLFHQNGDNTVWTELHDWQRLAITLCAKFTLNSQQKFAFLLIVNNRIRQHSGHFVDDKPFRIIIGGPGGTGKSHVYEALRAFYNELNLARELTFTAPTGVAACNIAGTTTHSELSLRTAYDKLTKANSVPLQKLVARLQATRLFVIDEFFFLGCKDFEKASRTINLARGSSDDAFGHLDLVLSGDEYQLTPPRMVSLFDNAYVHLDKSHDSLQGLNADVRQNLTAIKNYWSIENCVILTEVVRQRHPRYVVFLTRLRRGLCTVSGEDNDLDYLMQFKLGAPGCQVLPHITDITKWITSPKDAAPLITYTNAVRNAHNWRMSKAFAEATNQPFVIYYAEDCVGRGKNRTVLQGQNARDAWDTPLKSHAKDLSGRLPLIIGMPIYIVENLAVELGVANGSGGTLVNVSYEVKNGRRYALSADVDLATYTASDKASPFPKRVTIPLVTTSITVKKQGSDGTYSVRRTQLPLIPGFSFTAHNSQSRSLNAAIIHLQSCPSLAAAYVMLSRIVCAEDAAPGLAILGEVSATRIRTHAPEEVRREEKRLKKLAASTSEKARELLDWYTKATGENWHSD